MVTTVLTMAMPQIHIAKSLTEHYKQDVERTFKGNVSEAVCANEVGGRWQHKYP